MRTVLALLLAATAVAAPRAQSPAPGTSEGDGTAQTAAEASIDPTKLGVSLSRIRRGLRETETRQPDTGNPLRLEYQIQVFGTAPRIDILEGFDVGQGAPLSYGAPTHNDFVNHWTPQAYRSPPVPLSSLAGWALFQLVKRSDKSKCEKEIEEYRSLVMQGIPAAAPRCSQ